MKTLYIAAICALALLKTQPISAQNLAEFSRVKAEKANLFDAMPAEFKVYTAVLDKLFAFKINSKITIPVGTSKFFEGTVLDIVQRNAQVASINIKSSNYEGSVLTISRITEPGQPVTYAGRLLSIKHGDAFVMVSHGNEMRFVKQKQSALVVE